MELPASKRDLKAFLLNIIKEEVSVDKIFTKLLELNGSIYNSRMLETIEIQEPEVELKHIWKENGVTVIEGQFTFNIKHISDDDICFQIQIPFTPIGEEEHISDYEIYSFYYEDKLHSICTTLFWGVINYLDKF